MQFRRYSVYTVFDGGAAHASDPMGKLTTHVLDTAHGRPAAGMLIELRRLPADEVIFSARSNTDGRCGRPLLEGPSFVPGEYELVFHTADYFRTLGVKLSDPPFLDRIALRFGLSGTDQHYHVPLLVSPWSYSTYRGS